MAPPEEKGTGTYRHQMLAGWKADAVGDEEYSF